MDEQKPGLFERILCRFLDYQDIRDDKTGELYLRRFFLWRDNKREENKSRNRIYLHKFYRGDKDRDLHDHPWSFTTFILAGGYAEECFAHETRTREKTSFVTVDGRTITWHPKFSLLHRPATVAHRVIIPEGRTAWTLVLTSPKTRSWGFHTPKGWCPWRGYSDGVCWCDTQAVPR
jgi:hypothetical protein